MRIASLIEDGPSSFARRIAATATLLFAIQIHYLVKPARDGYLLDAWGTANLPQVNLAVLAASLLTAYLLGFLRNRVGASWLIPTSATAAALAFALIPFAMKQSPAVASIVCAVVVGTANLIGLAIGWGMANAAFSTASATREYGWLGLAGPVGAVGGASVARFVAERFGPGSLMFAGALLALALIPTGILLSKFQRTDNVEPFLAQEQQNRRVLDDASPRMAFRFSYTRRLLVLVTLSSVLGALLKWALFRFVELDASSLADRTALLARMYQTISFTSLAAQLVLTPVLLRSLGAARTLALIATLIVSGAVGAAIFGSWEGFCVVAVAFLSLDYTAAQCSRELLYVPTPLAIKTSARSYIDSFARPPGVAAGNFFISACTAAGIWGMAALTAAVVAAGGAWALIARSIGARHKALVEGGEVAQPATSDASSCGEAYGSLKQISGA